MITSSLIIVGVFILYLLAIFYLGVLAGKGMNDNEESYFLGNRSFGFYSSAMSSAATDTSGWIFIGAAGYAYVSGAEFMWMLPAYAFGGILSWLIVGPALRRQSSKLGARDLADYFEKKLNDKTHLIKVTATCIIILFFIPYLGSQLTAAGKTMNVVMNMDYNLAMVITAVVVVAYCFFGGYRAVMWTDTFQGTLMILILGALPVYLIFSLGGWGAFWGQLLAIDPILGTAASGKSGALAFGLVFGMMVMGLGTVGQPQNLQRYFTTKDATETFYKGMWVKAAFNIISMTGACLLGLAARIYLPNLTDSENAFPALVYELMPPVIIGIIIAGIFAAIQSTYSSQLLVVVQSIGDDLMKVFSKKQRSSKESVNLSRLIMIGMGILSLGLALINLDTVFKLILYAQSVMAAAFGPLLLMLLFWPSRVNKWGSFSGMVTGAFVTSVWYATGMSEYVWEIVPGSLSAILVLLLVTKLTNKKELTFTEEKKVKS
ncbi:sodium/proline symporter [Oceanobacillus sojae]|uniref:sodium/proline symporter n=1 Tax=Oceanobacillus sojae TaxID=582851 RepID=UPI0009883A3C|nr:sodium/proline symporter [Oceanobacillus sojae]